MTATKLKDYLIAENISQSDFAQRVGVTHAMVSSILSGRYKLRGKKAIVWAKATGWRVTPHDLNPDDYPNPTDGITK